MRLLNISLSSILALIIEKGKNLKLNNEANMKRKVEEAKRRAGRGFGHTRYDTVDKVDLRVMRECIGNAALAALRIVDTDDWPVEHRNQKEIDTLVKAQGYEKTVQLGKKLKEYLESRKDELRPETLVYLHRLKGTWEEVI